MAGLTALPSELRNAIYTPLLTGPSPTLSLLRVSRRLHNETASLFYQHNTFIVELPRAEGDESLSASILPPIPDKFVQYVRNLTLHVRLRSSVAAQAECARQVDQLVDASMELVRLTVHIQSNSSRFLARFVDDTVLTAADPLTVALGRLCARAQRARVEVEGVWFAPGVAPVLRNKSGEKAEVVSAAGGEEAVERRLVGQTTATHLRELGLDEGEREAAHDHHGLDKGEGEVVHVSPREALWDVLQALDPFSPADFFLGDEGADGASEMKGQQADMFVDEDFSTATHGRFGEEGEEGEEELTEENDMADGEEELTEKDDVADEEMLDIDDLEAILGNMEDVARHTTAERDMSFLTTFAPGILGGWGDVPSCVS
ncbi:hypothetical protein SVAN01_02121 [Stagonosporopsis vannaccii]|nr:hypothetical protein SVAN01_02121 [Stagonosporopsis vannaccii]